MSKIQWESGLAECPFCEQLKAIGCHWINRHKSGLMTDLLTGRVRVPPDNENKPSRHAEPSGVA